MYFIASKIAFNVYYKTIFGLLSSMYLSDYLKILLLVSCILLYDDAFYYKETCHVSVCPEELFLIDNFCLMETLPI